MWRKMFFGEYSTSSQARKLWGICGPFSWWRQRRMGILASENQKGSDGSRVIEIGVGLLFLNMLMHCLIRYQEESTFYVPTISFWCGSCQRPIGYSIRCAGTPGRGTWLYHLINARSCHHRSGSAHSAGCSRRGNYIAPGWQLCVL